MSSERPSLPTASALAALPPDGGADWNRLVFEKSPYLLQHAANPVDWWPWGEAAFDEARRRGVPVFLSIGYSTCHWCHVMERESFEDEEAARALNEAFVCVKVDREERPDVDHVYMTVTQAMTGHGGWPMTVILTPDREPFFAGTYFPKHGRHGRPGLLDLVRGVEEAWRERGGEVRQRAAHVVRALGEMTAGAAGDAPDASALERGEEQLAARFDATHGGFGGAPKFPSPHLLSFLVRRHARTGEPQPLEMVERTLDAMRSGGIWDHFGFGFHRYATDERWFLPHFEKMLHDQATMALACLDAHEASGEERHAETARRILEYVERDLSAPGGGFYSAEDADSEGEEGRFYVWTPAEVESVLGPEDATLTCKVHDIALGGNFRDEATGRPSESSIPHRPRPTKDEAERAGLAPEELEARLEASRRALLAARSQRVRPLCDDKVLTDWNGLMIAAFARAGRVLGEPAHAARAASAARFVLDELRGDDGRLRKRWRDGEAGLPAVLDDHAFLAWGLLELHQATLEVQWLEACRDVVEHMIRHHADDEGGGFFLTADDGEALPVRAKESHDGALPSGNSVAALVLVALGRLLGRPDFEERADSVFRAFGAGLTRAPAAHAAMLCALDLALGPTTELVVTGPRESEATRALWAVADERHRPNVLRLAKTPDEAEALAELAPWTRELDATAEATAHACRGGACSLPTTAPDTLRKQLDA